MTTSTDAVPSTWAPDRIWLQREQGDHGSHTWCEDSVGDGDIIEEVEYVRADRAKVQADHIADELREASRQFHNLTQGDPTVIIRPSSAEKRDAIVAAGERLRAALAASSTGNQEVGHD